MASQMSAVKVAIPHLTGKMIPDEGYLFCGGTGFHMACNPISSNCSRTLDGVLDAHRPISF